MKTLLSFFLSALLPIQFSIPEKKIVQEIPQKTRDFAVIIPGQPETYIFETEKSYYEGYQQSYFAITSKKGGWDCLRHYEILANGCIPYFLDLDSCDSETIPFLPKSLIQEAMHLDGISYLHIDHSKFPLSRYYEILNQLLAHTRQYLTCRKMGEYLLTLANYSGFGSVLYLSGDTSPDYQRCLNLIGLKEALGQKVVDVPKIEHIYEGYPDPPSLYGKGFSYTQILEDLPIDRENIEERIKKREFELIFYGSVHRGLPYRDLVCQTYEPEKIVYICGEDIHTCEFINLIHSSPFFIREPATRPK